MTELNRSQPSLAILLLGALAASCSESLEPPGRWAPAEGLKTRWAEEVDPYAPWPEYPRPLLVREEWVNLNGLWDLAILPRTQGMPTDYPHRILVPFPVESALGGLARKVTPEDRVWYHRTFSLPEDEDSRAVHGEGGRWQLHFGAVDWEAEVFVDGEPVGVHRGGYDPFSFDVTAALGEGPEHQLVVAVTDPTDQGEQPRGKQVLDPRGIWYTAVTGIWQTVWMEPVPPAHITKLTSRPSPNLDAVEITVTATPPAEGLAVRVVVEDGGREVASGAGVVGEMVSITIPEPRLWSPDDPFLYDLVVTLAEGDGQPDGIVDEVASYFGMRSIGVGPGPDGVPRLLLNGDPLFQYGLLDQGWWPDGLYTAPTDEALRFDVARSRESGFNLIRKHVKVEPARWYHHADREGILVWQDMPSGDNQGEEDRIQFARELKAMVDALRNHPSIVMWVPFNEGWGQHDTEPLAGWLKSYDPGRLVNAASGWTDEGGGDVLDVHRYPGPGAPVPSELPRWAPAPRRYPAGLPDFPDVRVAVLGEFGGLGLPLSRHTWEEEDNWGYRSFEDLDALNDAYRDLLIQLRPLQAEGLSAAVYTQTTDVEVEVNGIMTYDREVVKLSEESVRAHETLFDPPPLIREVVPSSREMGRSWSYTEEEPQPGWFEPGFDDRSWPLGPGGFGSEGTPGARVGTIWESSSLWLRRSFELSPSDMERLRGENLFLRVHHDEDAEIFLNGVRIATLEGYTTGYVMRAMHPDVVGLLREGPNTLAVHVRQSDGGQYIDVGIVEWIEAAM